jgi:syntaxin 18
LSTERAELASSRTSKLLRLLPARLTHQDGASVASEYLAAHNASVTWFLNRRLAEASQLQKEMQEERIKRQLERTRTLGSVASNPNRSLAFSSSLKREVSGDDEGTGSWLLPGSFTSMTASSAKTQLRPTSIATSFDDFEDDTDEEIELSQSQIQQFEEENVTILREAQDSLAAVQQAESRLMEISALQMELVNHLTQQAEITDQLYEDAIEAGGTVGAGNKQLIEARRRQKDSRLFILVFLLGATLALLFLHNY